MSTDQASDLYALYTPELVAIFIFLGVFIIILCCLQVQYESSNFLPQHSSLIWFSTNQSAQFHLQIL